MITKKFDKEIKAVEALISHKARYVSITKMDCSVYIYAVFPNELGEERISVDILNIGYTSFKFDCFDGKPKTTTDFAELKSLLKEHLHKIQTLEAA